MNIDLFKLFPHLQDIFEEEVLKELQRIKDKWRSDMREHNKNRYKTLQALKQYLRRSEEHFCYTLDDRDISRCTVLREFLYDKEQK